MRKEMGAVLRARRLELGLSQQELADRVGCSRQTVILLEQERYVPSLALAMKVARVFGTTVDDVFELAEES